MPFDFPMQNPAVEIIERAEARLATPDRWCKHALEDQNGANCLLGALNRVCFGMFTSSHLIDRGRLAAGVLHAIDAEVRLRGSQCVVDYNNAQTTTHDDILNLLRAAKERVAMAALA